MSLQKVTPAQPGEKSDLQTAIEAAHVACGHHDVRLVHSARFEGWVVVIGAPEGGAFKRSILQSGSDPILVLQEAANQWLKVYGGAS